MAIFVEKLKQFRWAALGVALLGWAAPGFPQLYRRRYALGLAFIPAYFILAVPSAFIDDFWTAYILDNAAVYVPSVVSIGVAIVHDVVLPNHRHGFGWKRGSILFLLVFSFTISVWLVLIDYVPYAKTFEIYGDYEYPEYSHMEPTLQVGDTLLIRRLIEKDIKAGRIYLLGWVFSERHKKRFPNFRWEGRVIGLPGDRIAVDHGRITRNGVLITQDCQMRDEDFFCTEDIESNITPYPVRITLADPKQISWPELVVPQGEVYIVPDYRGKGISSVTVGTINIDEIEDEVLGRTHPAPRSLY